MSRRSYSKSYIRKAPSHRRRRKNSQKNCLLKRFFYTAAVFVIVALFNGWTPPSDTEEAIRQSTVITEAFHIFLKNAAEQISISFRDSLQSVLKELNDPDSLESKTATVSISSGDIPDYNGEPYTVVNNNIPEFSADIMNGPAYEYYSELDSLGRCGYAEAKVTEELMPQEARGRIGMIRPSGWHTVKYDNIDGRYLYNRCHLLGYQLTGENANERNLITGTRYLNVTGMLPFENQVADYVRSTGHACMLRVTPLFRGEDLIARGVEMEAQSVEDNTVSFHVFVYNIQPGIIIDYATGNSWTE